MQDYRQNNSQFKRRASLSCVRKCWTRYLWLPTQANNQDQPQTHKNIYIFKTFLTPYSSSYLVMCVPIVCKGVFISRSLQPTASKLQYQLHNHCLPRMNGGMSLHGTSLDLCTLMSFDSESHNWPSSSNIPRRFVYCAMTVVTGSKMLNIADFLSQTPVWLGPCVTQRKTWMLSVAFIKLQLGAARHTHSCSAHLFQKKTAAKVCIFFVIGISQFGALL